MRCYSSSCSKHSHLATKLLERVNRILHLLGEELEIMETLSPTEFLRFRGLLKPSSGFESYQFRELELASGLRDPSYLRFVDKLIDMEGFHLRWPRTFHDAFVGSLALMDSDPVTALVRIYAAPGEHAAHHALAETVSDYELRFADWRYHHVQLVERVIGNRSLGTGGSAGAEYLYKTLHYRFFPELWEARNCITEGFPSGHGGATSSLVERTDGPLKE
jgi:tryptophan 2,3-dioxygenase